MALAKKDYYLILSDGLYSGALYEASITDKERYTRILTHGLLALAPTLVISYVYKMLKIGKTGIKFARGFFRIGV